MLLIGSRALSYHLYYHLYDDFREGNDWDFICTRDWFKNIVNGAISSGHKIRTLFYGKDNNHAHVIFRNGTIIEASFIDTEHEMATNDNAILDHECRTNKIVHEIFDDFLTSYVHPPLVRIASIDTLYMMKMSHRYKKDSPHFNKTMNDIKLMRREFGIFDGEINPDLQEIYQQRMKLTYTNKAYKLNVDKGSFFTDNVPYKYDHDSIHRAVAIGPVPAYTLYTKDGAEVMCDKNKFYDQPLIVRMNGVIEEAYVLALERSVIPHNTDPDRAFMLAIEKVCTSITSGWFREFAWEHYDAILDYHQQLKGMGWYYQEKFQKALAEGKILPYKR